MKLQLPDDIALGAAIELPEKVPDNRNRIEIGTPFVLI
jgi:3-keto-L-gulonate-6-phosphate decarboxylase